MAALPPVTAAFLKNAGLAFPPIEAFAPGIVGDGVANDSAAIKAAHDAAFAAGVREVYCGKTYNAPDAYNLGNVLFRGPGSINAYRKRVVSLGARPFVAQPRLVPAIHLPRFAKALSPNVYIWGDSTSTIGANRISAAEMLWAMLQRAFLRDNPGRTINRINRGIGGSTVLNYNSTGNFLTGAGLTLPTWYTVPAAPWTGFIVNPDLVIVNWGTNNAAASGIAAFQNVVSFLQSLSKVPDILFCTNLPRSTQADVGSAEYQALEDRDFAAGAIRSYAEFYGFACLDFHRIGCMARDGFDPCTQVMSLNTSATSTYALPAALPQTDGDFDLTFTIDNTGGAAFGSGQNLDVYLSSFATNVLRISNTGGFIQLVGYGGGVIWLGATNTGVALPTGAVIFDVATKGSWITIYANGLLLWEGLCLRHGGKFQPKVQYAVGSGPAQITGVVYISSTAATVAPSLTDAEMFGSGSFPSGGNAINHPASYAYNVIHAMVLDNVNFTAAAAGRPAQQITAAGAINPDASLVQLTGPASGTYAITLAAPRPQDQGNIMMIEMTATTGTNAVTMSLANVEGGTANVTCSWGAAKQKLILLGGASKWEIVKQDGVTLV